MREGQRDCLPEGRRRVRETVISRGSLGLGDIESRRSKTFLLPVPGVVRRPSPSLLVLLPSSAPPPFAAQSLNLSGVSGSEYTIHYTLYSFICLPHPLLLLLLLLFLRLETTPSPLSASFRCVTFQGLLCYILFGLGGLCALRRVLGISSGCGRGRSLAIAPACLVIFQALGIQERAI